MIQMTGVLFQLFYDARNRVKIERPREKKILHEVLYEPRGSYLSDWTRFLDYVTLSLRANMGAESSSDKPYIARPRTRKR